MPFPATVTPCGPDGKEPHPCRRGFTARYVRMPRLLHELAVGRGDGSYARLLARLAKLDLLAIDDWMLAPLRDAERRDLTVGGREKTPCMSSWTYWGDLSDR